jgi:hypothetical protein
MDDALEDFQNLVLAHRVASRHGDRLAGATISLGKWYMMELREEEFYFKPLAQQKNGGWSGVAVQVDLMRPRAAPKAKKYSMPKGEIFGLKEVKDLPEAVERAAKAREDKD